MPRKRDFSKNFHLPLYGNNIYRSMTGDHRWTQLWIRRTFPAPKECSLVMPLHQINLKYDSFDTFSLQVRQTRVPPYVFLPNLLRRVLSLLRESRERTLGTSLRFCHVVDYLNFRWLWFCFSTANRNWPWNPIRQGSRFFRRMAKETPSGMIIRQMFQYSLSSGTPRREIPFAVANA